MTKHRLVRSVFLGIPPCRTIGVLLAATIACGCLDEWGIDERLFPCREPADCTDGFVCDSERFVCVRVEDASFDGGVLTGDSSVITGDGGFDAGANDASQG
ncbi:MAG: hypothetical protein AAF449_06910 [Myxococcota bacterium]